MDTTPKFALDIEVENAIKQEGIKTFIPHLKISLSGESVAALLCWSEMAHEVKKSGYVFSY